MTGMTTRGAGFAILCGLAENGPATKDQMDAILLATGNAPTRLVNQVIELRRNGYLVKKTFLTPAGLAELQRLGWKPDLDTETET